MAVPTPPTAGEPIAEAWGDVVHDAVVAQDIQSGTGTASFSAANQGLVTVTFPRPFAGNPAVMIIPGPHSSGSMVLISAQLSSISPTQVGVRLVSTPGTNITVANVPFTWIAYGPRA